MKNAMGLVFLTALAANLVLFNSCKKEAGIPALTTTTISGITSNSATSGGNVTSDGGDAAVTARGVCWGTSHNPDITGNKTNDGEGLGAFTSILNGLSENTTYYVRAYAVTSVGTSYGNEVVFTSNSVSQATLTTSDVVNVTSNSAASGGNITSDGGGVITARGICWSTTPDPTIADSLTVNGTGTGDFTSSLTGLAPYTTYYVRAYATNSAGTAYGLNISFTTDPEVSPIIFNPSLTYGSVSDIDGNTYKTIQIGNQIWMAENLKTTKYNDDEAIPLVTDNSTWSNLTTHGYSWYNRNSGVYKDVYGALYNWYAVASGKLCPAGWHVFTQSELNTLKIHLGGGTDVGGKMKETETTHWALPNALTTNEAGWTGLPGGRRNEEGIFTSIGFGGYWWSATEFSSVAAVDAMLYYDFTFLDSNNFRKTNGMSVRCVKD